MMRITSWVAVVGFLLATGFGVWAAAPTNAPARIAVIEPFQLMITGTGLPTDDFVDYSLVFHK